MKDDPTIYIQFPVPGNDYGKQIQLMSVWRQSLDRAMHDPCFNLNPVELRAAAAWFIETLQSEVTNQERA